MNWPTFAFVLSDVTLLMLLGLGGLLLVGWAVREGFAQQRPEAPAAKPEPFTSRRVRAGGPVPDHRQPRKPAA